MTRTSLTRQFGILASVLALGSVSTLSAGVILQGPSYSPAGSNFTIVALQGIDSTDTLGQAGFTPQVNNNFEFTPSIGVSYEQGGKLTDFGLGLYQDASKVTQSTGVRINYNAPVDPFSLSVTVQDFDIKGNATGYNFQKVAPTLTLIGTNNQVVATFGQADIFPAMVQRTDKGKDTDIWDISFATLLQKAHLNPTEISSFVLAADMTNGEKANSDPYLLLAVGNGIPMVPEASNFIAGIVAVLIAGVAQARAMRRRNSAV